MGASIHVDEICGRDLSLRRKIFRCDLSGAHWQVRTNDAAGLIPTPINSATLLLFKPAAVNGGRCSANATSDCNAGATAVPDNRILEEKLTAGIKADAKAKESVDHAILETNFCDD